MNKKEEVENVFVTKVYKSYGLKAPNTSNQVDLVGKSIFTASFIIISILILIIIIKA